MRVIDNQTFVCFCELQTNQGPSITNSIEYAIKNFFRHFSFKGNVLFYERYGPEAYGQYIDYTFDRIFLSHDFKVTWKSLPYSDYEKIFGVSDNAIEMQK